MFPPRPQTRSFKVALRCDPALDRARFEASAAEHEALDDDQKARTPAPETFDAAYARCVERLDFSEITKPGEKPTFFVMKPLDGLVVRRLIDRFGHVTLEKLGAEGQSIVLRIGLIKVENWPNAPDWVTATDLGKQAEPPWGVLAPQQAVDDIDAVAVQLGAPWGEATQELAAILIMRSVLASGK